MKNMIIMTSKTPVKILVTNLERIITEKTLYTNDIKEIKQKIQ